MGTRYKSTVIKGIGKSRKGSPTISLQTLIDRTKSAAFLDELLKLSRLDKATKAELEEATKVLTEPKHKVVRKHIERGVVPAAISPGISAAARGVRAFVDAKRGRGGSAAMKAIKDTTRGGVVSDVVRGGLVGTGISVGSHGLQKQRAKETIEKFMPKRRRRRRK